MTYSWQNEDGEPIMDGAAWRFEQQLDMEAQEDYMADHFYDSFYDDEPDCSNVDEDDVDESGRLWCYGCDGYAQHTLNAEEPPDDDDDAPFVMEDQWLDGSYEE